MSTQGISSDIHLRLENFKAEDIKTLVQAQGKAIEGDKEFILKDIDPADPTLQMIINDPYFEVISIGDQTKSAEMYYDLKGGGRQIRVRVVCHKQKEEKKV
ncbi:MAG: hypothetical protein H0X26_01350 [Alphaproteobacteria bacterium]|nr:hypothetical protein [Alphaproteobacteria bacterium]